MSVYTHLPKPFSQFPSLHPVLLAKAEDVINKWNDLVVEDNHLKLKNNNFMLLDEIASELFV